MRLRSLCVSALCLVNFSFAAAQTAPSSGQPAQDQQTTPEPPAWSAGPINFSGLVDGYYSFNFQHPASRVNLLRNFDVRANEFSLNMAKLELAVDPQPIGARVDIGFGRAWDVFHATEPLDQGRGIMRLIPQAYVSVKPPTWGGFQFDFGKFYTSAGAELTETHLGWNYSRAFMYANGPYYHFGARMSKPIVGPWTLGFQVINGWNNVEDNNSGKTVGITSAIVGKKVSLFNNYYVGPEKTGTNDGYRHFFDTVVTISPTDRISTYINYDIGVDKDSALNGGNKNWYALGLAGRLQVTPTWAVAARYEVYNDIDGLITTTAQRLQEFTGTLEYKVAQGFLMRWEYRHDRSNVPFFERGNEPGSSKRQDTLLVGFVAYFGPKR